MTFQTPRFARIPSYEIAAIIAMSAGYGAELIAHLQANNFVGSDPHRPFLGFDKWRSAYPDIPSYATYLAERRNSTNGKVVSTRKPNITFAAGLKIATRFNLTEEYHVAFADDSTSVNFWDWIEQYQRKVDALKIKPVAFVTKPAASAAWL